MFVGGVQLAKVPQAMEPVPSKAAPSFKFLTYL
jgi:hypothetical protein